MWWQCLRKQLEAAVNGALSVSLLYSVPIPLFLSGDTAMTPSFLFWFPISSLCVLYYFAPKFSLLQSSSLTLISPSSLLFVLSMNLLFSFVLICYCPLYQYSLSSAVGKLDCGHVSEKMWEKTIWGGVSSQSSREQGSCVKALTGCLSNYSESRRRSRRSVRIDVL